MIGAGSLCQGRQPVRGDLRERSWGDKCLLACSQPLTCPSLAELSKKCECAGAFGKEAGGQGWCRKTEESRLALGEEHQTRILGSLSLFRHRDEAGEKMGEVRYSPGEKWWGFDQALGCNESRGFLEGTIQWLLPGGPQKFFLIHIQFIGQ